MIFALVLKIKQSILDSVLIGVKRQSILDSVLIGVKRQSILDSVLIGVKRQSILDSVLIGHIVSTSTKLILKSCMNARPEPDKN